MCPEVAGESNSGTEEFPTFTARCLCGDGEGRGCNNTIIYVHVFLEEKI